MLHLVAFVQDYSIENYVKDYGYWGDIRDQNSELYVKQNPYENVPLYEYGYWGFIRDNYAKIVTTDSVYRLRVLNLKSISDERSCKFKLEALRHHERIEENCLQEEILLNSLNDLNESYQMVTFIVFSNLKNIKNLNSIYEQIIKHYNPLKIFIGSIDDVNEEIFLNIKFHTCSYSREDFLKKSLKQIEQSLLKLYSTSWLMSNIFDEKKQHLPITKCNPYLIIEANSIKIGFMALLQLNEFNNTFNFKYVDYLSEANRLSDEMLKRGCTLIVALTHLNSQVDEYLALNANNIDLILSGSKSDFEIANILKINNRWIIRVGDMSGIQLIKTYFNHQTKQLVNISISNFKI